MCEGGRDRLGESCHQYIESIEDVHWTILFVISEHDDLLARSHDDGGKTARGLSTAKHTSAELPIGSDKIGTLKFLARFTKVVNSPRPRK